MKAWIVLDKNGETGAVIVYAETRGKAVSLCMNDESFEDYDYIELYAKRFKEYDKYYDGKEKVDFWNDEQHRTRLVKDFGWSCIDGKDYYCDDCPAKEWCQAWEL